MNTGYLPINRKIFEHKLWTEKRELSKFEAWIDLLATASFDDKEKTELIGLNVVKWGRGELPASLRFLQNRWGWGSTKKVKAFLELLHKLDMIRTKTETGQTVITICKYDTYNPIQNKKKHEGNSKETARKHEGNKTNKDNKDNNNITTNGGASDEVSEVIKSIPGDKKEFTFIDKYNHFLGIINDLTKRNFRGDSTSKKNLAARLKDGYKSNDFKVAIENCISTDFYKSKPNFLTPEYITKQDKLEMWLNAKAPEPEFIDKGCGRVVRTQEEIHNLYGGLNPNFTQPEDWTKLPGYLKAS